MRRPLDGRGVRDRRGRAARSCRPPGPPEIAFAGRSNAGKSSAINVLARRTRLAFASRTPGRTQQIIFFALARRRTRGRPAGLRVRGGLARHQARWQDFAVGLRDDATTLVGLVLVVDARHGLKPLDLDAARRLRAVGATGAVLATKSDKLNRAERRDAVAGIALGGERRYRSARPRDRAAVLGDDAAWRRRGRRGARRWLP